MCEKMARYNLKTGRCSHGGMTAAHSRSQSMPEAVYFQHMVGLPLPPPPPPQRPPPGQYMQFMESTPGNLLKPTSHRRQYSTSGTALRRSQTNVGDLRKNRLSTASGRFGSSQYLASNWSIEEGQYGHALYAKPHELYLQARSRSNIASMYPNGTVHSKEVYIKAISPPIYQHRSMGFLGGIPEPKSRSQFRQTQSCRDLGKPLHVDCSVEYDLGHQPKIPKDSAPLLIIHPDYQSHSYGPHFGSTSSSPSFSASSQCTPIKSMPHHPGITQSVPPSKPRGTAGLARNRITRHCSFLESSPFDGMLLQGSHASQLLLPNNTSSSLSSTSTSKLSRTTSKAASCKTTAAAIHLGEQYQLNQGGLIAQAPPLPPMVHQMTSSTTDGAVPNDKSGRSRHPHRRGSRSLWAVDNHNEKGFHLSLPDLNQELPQENNGCGSTRGGQSQQASLAAGVEPNHRLQPRARLNLSGKLAASHKLSNGSKDSALIMTNSEHSSCSSAGSNYEMNDLVGGYDSGLGTPSSLTIMESDEGPNLHPSLGHVQIASHPDTPPSGMSSKWKNSMSGLVSGILCCSGGLLQSGSKSSMVTYSVTATVNNPSSMGVHEDEGTSPISLRPTPAKDYQTTASLLSTMSSLSSSSTMSGDYHPWSAHMSNSPPYTTSSIPEESESGMGCPNCHSSLADCRDGFCASVWANRSRERAIMRLEMPIHI